MRDVALLRDQGRWPEARAAARRAEWLLAQAANSEQQKQLSQLLVDLDLAASLEEIGLQLLSSKRDARHYADADQAYAAAFRDYGIDALVLDPAASSGLPLCCKREASS